MVKLMTICLASIVLSMLTLTKVSAVDKALPEFSIMTERFEPYQYEENGIVKGAAVDLMVLLLERVGSKQTRDDVQIVPWARGYRMALSEENTILFSTTRSAGREDLFKWVGPIFEHTISFIAKKDRHITITSKEDLRKYSFAIVVDEVSEHYLPLLGISDEQIRFFRIKRTFWYRLLSFA